MVVMKTNTLKKMVLCGTLIGLPAGLLAQGQEDPFSGNPGKAKQQVKRTTIKVVYEVFSLPMKKAAAIQRSGLSDTDFYGKMVAGLKDESVKQVSFLMVRSDSGQKVTGEQIQEYIYPTEYEPAELPNTVANTEKSEGGKKIEGGVFPVTPATPTSYDTRLLGEILEVEAMSDADGKTIHLRVAPTRVSLIQRESIGQGVSKVEMPRIANPRLMTGVVTKSGKPAYLGTVSDPSELQKGEKEDQVFFAFVTATNVAQ